MKKGNFRIFFTLALGMLIIFGVDADGRAERLEPRCARELSLIDPNGVEAEAMRFVGTWNRSYVASPQEATLSISKNKGKGKLYVRLSACNGGDEGILEANALISDNDLAVTKFVDGDGNVFATITYKLEGDRIKVSCKGDLVRLNIYNGVKFDGTYVKGKPVYTDL